MIKCNGLGWIGLICQKQIKSERKNKKKGGGSPFSITAINQTFFKKKKSNKMKYDFLYIREEKQYVLVVQNWKFSSAKGV